MGVAESFIINHYQWAYLILFAGMFIDSEAFFLTAAIFALQGYFSWPWLVAVVFIGVLLGDITFYHLGRYFQTTRFAEWIHKKFSNYGLWLDKNFLPRYAKMAFYSKFIYYVNRITPFIAGWHKLEFKKFLKIHFYADIFWLIIMLVAANLLRFVVDAIGAHWILKRMEFIFPALVLIFFLGEYIVKKIFTKKITKTLSKS